MFLDFCRQKNKDGEIYTSWVAHAQNTFSDEFSNGIFTTKYTQCNYIMGSNGLGTKYKLKKTNTV